MENSGKLSEAPHVDVNISEAAHKPFRCAIPAPQQYSHTACGLSWQPFYLSNYKFSQLTPSSLYSDDKLWIIKEQSTNPIPVSSRIFTMVELIKKRGKSEDIEKPLLSPKAWNYPRETPIRVSFITRCWRKSQTKLCFLLFVLPQSTFFSPTVLH